MNKLYQQVNVRLFMDQPPVKGFLESTFMVQNISKEPETCKTLMLSFCQRKLKEMELELTCQCGESGTSIHYPIRGLTVKSCEGSNPAIITSIFPVVLCFETSLGSSAAQARVKFQNNTIMVTRLSRLDTLWGITQRQIIA